ncbi:sulfurtransferase complex subunit TusB [Thalassotalea piscium]
MTTLHLIRDSALSNNTVKLSLTNLAIDDVLVLLDDGCYNVNLSFMDDVHKVLPDTQCYAITPHLRARDLSSETINTLSYKELLELIMNHNNVITWQ